MVRTLLLALPFGGAIIHGDYKWLVKEDWGQLVSWFLVKMVVVGEGAVQKEVRAPSSPSKRAREYSTTVCI